MTAQKLILEKKIRKKKQLSIMQENYARTYICTATYVMKHSWTLCCTVTKFETCR